MSCETTKNMFQLVFVFVFLSWILVVDATSLGKYGNIIIITTTIIIIT